MLRRIFLLSVTSGNGKLSFAVANKVNASCLHPPWGRVQYTGECDFNSASQGWCKVHKLNVSA